MTLILATVVGLIRPQENLAFVALQEEWIIDTLPAYSATKGLDPRFGSEWAKFVRMMGCEHFECRQVASDYLASQSVERVLPLLVWGSRHVDPEIRYRSKFLLDTMFFNCKLCEGCGEHRMEYYSSVCAGCGGKGNFYHPVPP